MRPNVVLSPRHVYEDIKQKRIQPDVLFYATVMVYEPEITPKEMEERYGARLDEILYLFEDQPDNNPAEATAVEGRSEATGEPETDAADSFEEQAEQIFAHTIGRESGIRSHQFQELFNKTGGDLEVVQTLANIVAKNEKEGDRIRFVDKFIFKVLSSTPLERLKGKQGQKQSKIKSEVERVLASIPPPPEETGPGAGGYNAEKAEKLKAMGLGR